MTKKVVFKVVSISFFLWFIFVGLIAAYRYCYLFVYGFELLPIPHTGVLHFFVSLTSFGFIYFFITQVAIMAAAYLSFRKKRTAYIAFLVVLLIRIYEILFPYSIYTEVYRSSRYFTGNTIAVLSWVILAIYCYFNFTKITTKSSKK